MDHSLVLLGRFPGKDRAVATVLARDFGRDEAWGMQIVGAAPIILLEGLTAEQAQAVHAALEAVEGAGSRLEIRQGADANLPKLSWPAPPRIKGKLVNEFSASGVAAVAATGGTVSLLVPCPYTGQKMKLTLTISLSRAADQISASVSATAAPATPVAGAPIPIPVPAPRVSQSGSANAAYRPIPTPVVTPVRPPKPPTPAAPAARPPSVSAPAPLISGLDELDELEPMEQSPAPQSPAAAAVRPPSVVAPAPRPAVPVPAPAPARARSVSGPVPLPDVPVLSNAPASPPPAGPGLPAPMPIDLMSAPMDLSAFESKVSASGIMHAVTVTQPDAAAGAEALPEIEPVADDGSLCAVSIGKSTNPKVHQLVSELLGVSPQEGAKLCQKPILTIAKDVSMSEAQNIKQQFAGVGVAAKITSRRG